jgi:hypothetical protein
MQLYQTAGGTRVFNAGTMHWTHNLDRWSGLHLFRKSGSGGDDCPKDANDCFDHENPVVRQATVNILRDFGAQPATPATNVIDPAPADWAAR